MAYDFKAMMEHINEIDPGIAPLVQTLLGCEWGRTVSTPDDREPCPEGAKQIVVVHPPGGSLEDVVATVRLCEKHLERLEEETIPHG